MMLRLPFVNVNIVELPEEGHSTCFRTCQWVLAVRKFTFFLSPLFPKSPGIFSGCSKNIC